MGLFAESVPDRASGHTGDAAFQAVSAPEQYFSAPLLKVERAVFRQVFETAQTGAKEILMWCENFTDLVAGV